MTKAGGQGDEEGGEEGRLKVREVRPECADSPGTQAAGQVAAGGGGGEGTVRRRLKRGIWVPRGKNTKLPLKE